MTRSKLRTIFTALAFCGAAAAASASTIPTDQVTYSFTGDCTDCSNSEATLTLMNYTPGTALSDSNFVSFQYTSSIAEFNASTPLTQFSGDLGSTTGSYNFYIETRNNDCYTGGNNHNDCIFQTYTDGTYNYAGSVPTFDQGTNGVWSLTQPGPLSPTPEPGSLTLLGTGVAALVAMRRRAKGMATIQYKTGHI